MPLNHQSLRVALFWGVLSVDCGHKYFLPKHWQKHLKEFRLKIIQIQFWILIGLLAPSYILEFPCHKNEPNSNFHLPLLITLLRLRLSLICAGHPSRIFPMGSQHLDRQWSLLSKWFSGRTPQTMQIMKAKRTFISPTMPCPAIAMPSPIFFEKYLPFGSVYVSIWSVDKPNLFLFLFGFYFYYSYFFCVDHRSRPTAIRPFGCQ